MVSLKYWFENWRTDLLPGISITGLVILTRVLGGFQSLEWQALDFALKSRPAEPTDERITLIAINDRDIQTVLDYPISDQVLADLIQTVESYNPRVVGLDIFRDRPVGEGADAFVDVLQTNDNLVAISKIMGDSPIVAPAVLPESQIGFADALVDEDGYLRRSLLGSSDLKGNYHLSLTIRLVEKYIVSDGLRLKNGLRDPETMRFGETEIPRFQSNTGGYIRTPSGGNQTLINFRAGSQPFIKVSYEAVISGDVPSTLLQDRVVLIGYEAESVKDFVSSRALVGINPSLVPGVVVQAHAVSQILSAIYDNRPLLRALPDGFEYALILISGGVGMTLAYWQRRPALHLLLMVGLSVIWVGLAYFILAMSLWVPVVPMLAAFLLNGGFLYSIFQAQVQLRSQLEERQTLIDWSYNTIHNGPLQILVGILRIWPVNQEGPANLREDLQHLNQELRGIYDTLRQEMLLPEGNMVLAGHHLVNMEIPLAEMLYEIYKNTVDRHPDFFGGIIHITDFKPLPETGLNPIYKRSLGRFLEEALTNVYKYAQGTTRLQVICLNEGANNVIRVIDNGFGGSPNPSLTAGGDGTRQAVKLARQLGGKFSRVNSAPQGVSCELQWPVERSFWKRWLKSNSR